MTAKKILISILVLIIIFFIISTFLNIYHIVKCMDIVHISKMPGEYKTKHGTFIVSPYIIRDKKLK